MGGKVHNRVQVKGDKKRKKRVKEVKGSKTKPRTQGAYLLPVSIVCVQSRPSPIGFDAMDGEEKRGRREEEGK